MAPLELTYLQRLTVRLTIGAAQLDPALQERHARFIVERQRSDGGWSGREGESDLYYTSFALRSLAILGLLEGSIAERAGAFLRSRLTAHETLVDLMSLVYSAKLLEAACGLDAFEGAQAAWAQRLALLLDRLRRDDGGYSKSFEGHVGSTYQTFLVLLCLELIEQPIPEPERIAKFLHKQRQADGGFLEVRVGKRSGTNPTAAGIGALQVLNQLTPEISQTAGQFLCDLQTDEGGWQANTRIPLPDLLSTFTACVTLADVEALEAIDRSAALRYGQSMQRRDGGFCGFEFDPSEDVEYTFYGLWLVSLLHT
ncbi:MAG: terpene cyclase/mutase family protein [Pirellulaceae bacterium]|nr:terpene cyclase/mutase family protein [Pirellulaceae bacterium]